MTQSTDILGSDLTIRHVERTGQDPNDPVWADSDFEPAGYPRVGHEGHAVRTISGALDTLGHVVDELTEWVERESPEGPAHRRPRDKAKPMAIPTVRVPSESWRANTYDVGTGIAGIQGIRIVVRREDRTRVVVTNSSAAVVKLAADSTSGGSQNVITLAAGTSREFYTKDEIWAYPNTPGTAQLIDVQDEYGCAP